LAQDATLLVDVRAEPEYLATASGSVEGGHRMIVGLYSGSGGKIVIDKSPGELNDTTLEEGCGIVNVLYDLTIHKVVDVRCHGEA
jgi:hypothetical protein